MGLETGTYIDSLVTTNPASTDGLAQADDHLRLIKSTLKSTFPSITGAVSTTQAELNVLDGITSSTSELNVLDGITATTAELNFTDGVTSNIQTQLNAVTTTAAAAIVPSGIISLWSGASNAIPTGYALCDGTNNTPDLRNRFVIGAGSTYAVGATGGSADATVVAHTHTGTTNTTGAHTHLIPHNYDSATAGNYISGNDGPNNISGANNESPMSSAGDHSHTLTTDSTGSSGTNANLPPYYALCYIMKT